MSECSHNCGTCGENCSSRTQDKKSFLEALAPESSVKKVIGDRKSTRLNSSH